MLTTIKDFVGGIVTDGDSPDLPPNSSRILNNFDIDKSTQKLVVRQPFYPYTELRQWPGEHGFFPYHVVQYTVGIVEPKHNTMVVLRSRDKTLSDPDRWNWRIYDNGPKGGDGNDFVFIAQEDGATDCNPEPVLGRVRLALGNDKDYRILWQHTNTQYFRKSINENDYIVGPTQLHSILDQPNGEFFESGVGGMTDTYTYQDGRLYLSKGSIAQLSTNLSTVQGSPLERGKYEFILSPVFDNFPEQFGAPVATAVAVVDQDPVIVEANVSSIVNDVTYKVHKLDIEYWRPLHARFSYLKRYYGAEANITTWFKGWPIWMTYETTQVGVVGHFKTEGDLLPGGPGMTNGRMQDARPGSSYEIALGNYTPAEVLYFFYEACTIPASPQGYAGTPWTTPINVQAGDLYIYRRILQPNAATPVGPVEPWTKVDPAHYTITIQRNNGTRSVISPADLVALGDIKTLLLHESKTVRDTISPPSGGITPPLPGGLTNPLGADDVIIDVDFYNFQEIEPDAYFSVVYNGREIVGDDTFTVPASPAPTTVDVFYTDHTGNKQNIADDISGVIPYFVTTQPVVNPVTPVLFQGQHYRKVRSDGLTPIVMFYGNVPWQFYYISPLITADKTKSGIGVSIEASVPTFDFNPRLKEMALFARKTLPGMPISGDYALIQRFGVRSDSQVSILHSMWQEIGNFARISMRFSEGMFERNVGTWSEKYDVDGIGFRPYDHTLADITRRMRQMIAMRDRMHGIGIDGDEGQELVGRTPVSAGQSQLDVWYKPLIAHAGKGQAVLSAIEFQDRLLWFQRSNLIYGSFGDSRRAADYQFMNTGGIAGTHLRRTIAKSNDAVFFANYDGIFRFDGSKPSDITTSRINDYWRYSISKAQKDVAVAGFNKKTNEYWLYIPDDPDRYARLNDFVDPDYPFIGRVWIWDDNEYPARSWRTYTLDDDYLRDTTIMKTFSPTLFLCDKDDNWIFVNSFATLQNNAYFWPGESYIGTDPHYPISFAMQTQNFGERSTDLVPDMFRLVGEDNPLDYNLEVNIYRDNTTADTETLTLKALNRRQRRLDRRRSSTLRIGISGVYNPLTQVDPVQNQTLYNLLPHTTDKAKAALQEEYMRRRPEIREIHFDVLPNPRRT